MIRATYSPEGDTLGIDLEGIKATGRVRTVTVAPGILADVDAKGRLIGLEVFGASRFYPTDWLSRAGDPTEWLTLRQASAEAEAEGTPISTEQLRGLLNAGTIEGRKVGRDWMIGGHVLWNYLETRRPAGRPARRQEKPAKRRTRRAARD